MSKHKLSFNSDTFIHSGDDIKKKEKKTVGITQPFITWDSSRQNGVAVSLISQSNKGEPSWTRKKKENPSNSPVKSDDLHVQARPGAFLHRVTYV